MSEPFRQGRFADLPETARIPHPYLLSKQEKVSWSSRPFGRFTAHVRVHGQGPPLLLVHGLMTSSYSWRYVLEPLGAHFTLYAPDLPGAGRSDKPTDPAYSPENLAEWLGELTGELGIRGCATIGNSMGGYLCMHLALRDPSVLGRLVNLHSPGVPEARLYALAAAFAIPGARRLFRWLVQRDPLAFAHQNVHYYDESLKSLEEAREYGSPLATPEGLEAFRKYLTETMALGPMRAFQQELTARRARSEPFPVPLLLVYARRDPMVPPRFGAVFQERIPSARLEWLDEASHFAHVDAVDRFVPCVLPFLKGETS